jgi:predicted amidohydrolase YtcJ
MNIKSLALCGAIACSLVTGSAFAQAPDVVLVNGKMVTLDPQSSVVEALAVDNGKVAAVGTSSDIRAMAGEETEIIDLQGRTVIPGLIDSHIHAIRAALSFATEVNWIGTSSIPEAMDRISAKAAEVGPGEWIIVAGGWTPQQFEEKRRPTQAELVEAAPDNPVYVQLFYSSVLLTPKGFEALGIAPGADVPGGGTIETGDDGQPTGWINGGVVALFNQLPAPTFAEQVEGTKLFFRELNRLGLTGFVDPGGFGMGPEKYPALFKVWRDGDLTIRVAYMMCSQDKGEEFARYKEFTQYLPAQFGDDMLHANGLGERITYGMYNNENPTEEEKQALYEVALWAAKEGRSVSQHWHEDAAVHHLLDVFERVNEEVPIADLHWTIIHLNNASEETLQRMKDLGVGWAMQDAMYFNGDELTAEEAPRTPPIVTAIEMGVNVGAGTDAHRVMSYNPFAALQWMLDGKTVGGTATRREDEIPTREDALRLYTLGSAWVARDEAERGSLEVGKFADLAVLSSDYMEAPVEEIGDIESLLTMVGGKVVYAADPFADLDETAMR